MSKVLYSMFKNAVPSEIKDVVALSELDEMETGWSNQMIEVSLIEESRSKLKMIVCDHASHSFSRTENNPKIGNLFDLFMYFASLEKISIKDVEDSGFSRMRWDGEKFV